MAHRFNLKKYAKETSGQFSIMFALGASVIMAGSAVAVDMTNLQKNQSLINDIADAASLAGASASEMNSAQRLKIVKEAIEANMDPEMYSQIEGTPFIKFDDTSKEVTVAFNIKSKPILAGVLGHDKLAVSTTSVSSYAQSKVNPVSISFALDVSGSMGWNTSDGQVKIQALKDSVNAMFLEIEDQVDNPGELVKSLRTGMSTYNTSLRASTHMTPGWRNMYAGVNRLAAGGGTNSTPSLEFAHTQILDDRRFRQSNPRYQGVDTKEFVIFMTDGDNNRPEWDDSSRAVCDQMKNDGIEVFTVAFAAPENGQILLENCASDDKDAHYFDAANAQAFNDAFREIGKEIVERGVRIKS